MFMILTNIYVLDMTGVKYNPIRIPNMLDYATGTLSGVHMLYGVISASYAAGKPTLRGCNGETYLLSVFSFLLTAFNCYNDNYRKKDIAIDNSSAILASIPGIFCVAPLQYINFSSYTPIQQVVTFGTMITGANIMLHYLNRTQYSSRNRKPYGPLANNGLIWLYSFMQCGLFTGCILTAHAAQVATCSVLKRSFSPCITFSVDFIAGAALLYGLSEKSDAVSDLLYL